MKLKDLKVGDRFNIAGWDDSLVFIKQGKDTATLELSAGNQGTITVHGVDDYRLVLVSTSTD